MGDRATKDLTAWVEGRGPTPRGDGARAPSDDAVLVGAAVLGDRAAFDRLLRRYRPSVVRLARGGARRAGASAGAADALAEDAFQDASLRAWMALDTLRQPERFAHWLTTIARNRLQRLLERHRRRRSDADPSAALERRAHPGPNAVHQLERMESKRAVRAAVGALQDRYREPIELHYFDGSPLKDISAVLGIPVSTVKWRMFQGRRQLRAVLGARGEDQ